MAFTPDAALAYLRRANEEQRLAHAYLISGPAGSGKWNVAAGLAATLNNISSQDVLNAYTPDVFVTEPTSRSRRIVIDQIRSLERALQLRAGEGRKKVGIIRDADRMQPQAANAFLKTLEEPPRDSLLLLLTSLPEALPETILSRCLPLLLRIPSQTERSAHEKELLRVLSANAESAHKNGVSPSYRVAQGIQRLFEAIREEVRTEHAELLRNEEQRYRNTTDGAWLSEREDYFKALTESVYRERRSRLIETLFLWWAAVLRVKVQASGDLLPEYAAAITTLAARLSANEVLKKIHRLEEMRDQLNTTAQETLVLETACLRVFN